MPEAEILATGEGEYQLRDPDTLRAWMRDRKRRDNGAIDRVIGAMGVKSRVAEHVERLPPPSMREIEIRRHHIHPARTVIRRTAKS